MLARVEEVGIEAAAKEAGVTIKTIEKWAASRARTLAREADAVEVDTGVSTSEPDDFALVVGVQGDEDHNQQLRRTAQAARRAAEEAIARLREVLPGARGPQAIAIAAGVAIDKAKQIEDLLREEDERKVRLAVDQAELVADVLTMFVQVLGLPDTDATRRVIRRLLEQASAGEIRVVSPADAEQARADMREKITAEVRREIEAERLALPAPRISTPVDIPDATPDDPTPVEVVDAEVVGPSVEQRAADLAQKLAEETDDPWDAMYGNPRQPSFDMPRRF